jgi:hypothetical protein
MERSIKLIVAVCFAIILLLGAVQVFGQNRAVLGEAERVTGDSFTFSAKTAKGANVYGAAKPSRAMLTAIDKGLDDLFAVAKKNRYNNRLKYSDYTIFIAKADRTKDAAGSYSPDIAVGAAQYAGTEYDKGGYIYAAGMVIAFNPMSFVIADHTSNLSRVSDIVRYEGEHLVLYHNDRRKYSQTADHSQGGGHPILQ